MNINSIISIVIALVILLVIVPVGAYFIFTNQNAIWNSPSESTSLDDSEVTENQINEPAKLSGKMFLSLSPKNSPREAPISYVFDIEKQELSPSDMDTFGDSFKTYIADLDISPNGQWAAFKGFKPSEAAQYNPVTSPQIHRVRLDSPTSISDIAKAISSNSQKLTNISVSRKHSSSVNNKGEILMISVDSGDIENIQPVENFTIRHISSNNDIKILTNGFLPRWITDTNFVFFKNDGLYTYSLTNNVERLLLAFKFNDGEGLFNDVKMSVSDDTRFIAISIPKRNILTVLGVDMVDGEPTLNSFLKELPISGFWPTFSPDGEFLAIQGVNADTFETDPKPFLSFWRTSDFVELEDLRVDLDDYRQAYMFIDDWIK